MVVRLGSARHLGHMVSLPGLALLVWKRGCRLPIRSQNRRICPQGNAWRYGICSAKRRPALGWLRAIKTRLQWPKIQPRSFHKWASFLARRSAEMSTSGQWIKLLVHDHGLSQHEPPQYCWDGARASGSFGAHTILKWFLVLNCRVKLTLQLRLRFWTLTL